MLSGNIDSLTKLIYNCASYACKLFDAGYAILANETKCKSIPLNYKYLVSIVASLGNQNENITSQYLVYTNGYEPDFVRKKSVTQNSLYGVVNILL